MKSYNRYIFLDFSLLARINVKMLERVSDKIYILAQKKVLDIPFSLVKRIQKHGKRFKWIATEAEDSEQIGHHLYFILGELHGKVGKEIEFAVLSNDSNLDASISYMNSIGRNAVRVEIPDKKKNKGKDKKFSSYTFAVNPAGELEEDRNSKRVSRVVKNVVGRLMQSGNRPAEVSMLKSYILLHNDEKNIASYLDEVILGLEDSKEIEIDKGEVIYKF